MTYEAYATRVQLSTYLGDGLAGDYSASIGDDAVDRLLLRASTLVDTIPNLRGFSINATTGIPTDGDVAAAMADAVCAQLEYWFEIGGHGQTASLYGEAADILRIEGEAKVGKTSIPSPSKFAPRAIDILTAAGMLGSGLAQTTPSLADEFFQE